MEQRQAPRLEIQVSVGMRRSGMPKKTAHLLDVSAGGGRVELPERAREGETVWLYLPGLDSIESKVAWSRDWTAGLEFARPLHQAVLDAVVARLKG